MSGNRQRSAQATDDKIRQYGSGQGVTLAVFAPGQAFDAKVADVVQQRPQRKLVAPGHLATPGVRQAQLQRINEGVTKALQAPDVRDKLATFTYEAYTMAPAEMAKLMQQEVVKWGPTIKQAAIKLD